MWQQLRALKDLREQQASSLLRGRRHELAQAQAERDAAATRLQLQRRLADERERALFGGLMQRRVRLRDIEAVQQAVAALRQAEQRLDQARREAVSRAEQAQRQAHEALAGQQQAERAREKFMQLADGFEADRWRDAERQGDDEMDEVAARRRDADDWGPGEEDGR